MGKSELVDDGLKLWTVERLRQNIGELVACGHMGYPENTVLHILSNKVIGDGDVFHSGVEYRIGGEKGGTHIITIYGRLVDPVAELFE